MKNDRSRKTKILMRKFPTMLYKPQQQQHVWSMTKTKQQYIEKLVPAQKRKMKSSFKNTSLT